MTSNLAPGAGPQPLLAQRPPRSQPRLHTVTFYKVQRGRTSASWWPSWVTSRGWALGPVLVPLPGAFGVTLDTPDLIVPACGSGRYPVF